MYYDDQQIYVYSYILPRFDELLILQWPEPYLLRTILILNNVTTSYTNTVNK